MAEILSVIETNDDYIFRVDMGEKEILEYRVPVLPVQEAVIVWDNVKSQIIEELTRRALRKTTIAKLVDMVAAKEDTTVDLVEVKE